MSTQTKKFPMGAWLAIFWWPVVVVAFGLYWNSKRQEAALAEATASVPEIVVVDDIALVSLAIENGADQYRPAEIMQEIGRIVERNGLGDAVLLSKSMVLYSPVERQMSVGGGAQPKPNRELQP